MFCPNCSKEMQDLTGRGKDSEPYTFSHGCGDCGTLIGKATPFPSDAIKGKRFVVFIPDKEQNYG